MKKLSILGIFLTLLSVTLTAHAQGFIRGRFIDAASGDGIPEVSITGKWVCAGDHFSYTFTLYDIRTDADGRYSYYDYYYDIYPNSACPISYVTTTFYKPGYQFGDGAIGPDNEIVRLGASLPSLANVSAADYRTDMYAGTTEFNPDHLARLTPRLTAEMITATFGAGMAQITEAATTMPLPTSLAGRSILVRDSQGVERAAELLYVSPSQINYVIPSGLALGPATVKLIGDSGIIRVGFIQLQRVVPGIFTADASGKGPPAAVVQRIKADGTVTYEPVAQFDPAQNKYVPIPIDLGPETDQVFLDLFGTGIRSRTDLSSIKALGFLVGFPEVTYAGPQRIYSGVDQVNIRLPRSLIGLGKLSIDLLVETALSNHVEINIK